MNGNQYPNQLKANLSGCVLKVTVCRTVSFGRQEKFQDSMQPALQKGERQSFLLEHWLEPTEEDSDSEMVTICCLYLLGLTDQEAYQTVDHLWIWS